jgi:hypothetical protein
VSGAIEWERPPGGCRAPRWRHTAVCPPPDPPNPPFQWPKQLTCEVFPHNF